MQGGSEAFFGPYELSIGCTSSIVTFTDNSALVTDKTILVGDSLTGAYTFQVPDSTRSWCTLVSTEIVQAGN